HAFFIYGSCSNHRPEFSQSLKCDITAIDLPKDVIDGRKTECRDPYLYRSGIRFTKDQFGIISERLAISDIVQRHVRIHENFPHQEYFLCRYSPYSFFTSKSGGRETIPRRLRTLAEIFFFCGLFLSPLREIKPAN